MSLSKRAHTMLRGKGYGSRFVRKQCKEPYMAICKSPLSHVLVAGISRDLAGPGKRGFHFYSPNPMANAVIGNDSLRYSKSQPRYILACGVEGISIQFVSRNL